MIDLRRVAAPIEEARKHEFKMNLLSHLDPARQMIDDRGINFNDHFQRLSADEIYNLGLNLLEGKNIWEAYDFLAQPMSNGICGYDAIFGPTGRYVNEGLGKCLKKFTPRHMEKGLDIGVGTGQSTLELAKRCDLVVGIDIMPSMLAIANVKLKKARARFELHAMDIRDAHFDAESFDIVISEGMGNFINQVDLRQIFQTMHQLLKAGGSYCQYSPRLTSQSVYGKSDRGTLVFDVVRYVQYLTMITSGNDWGGEQIDIRNYGFKEETHRFEDSFLKGTFSKFTKA